MRAAVPSADNDKRYSLSEDKLSIIDPSLKQNAFPEDCSIMMFSSVCLDGRGINIR
jgi:hypothetical protein